MPKRGTTHAKGKKVEDKPVENPHDQLNDDLEGEPSNKVLPLPEFPPRMFGKDDHPFPRKSITQYATRRDLLDSLRTALHEDEWQELRNSHLGVLVKFYELRFAWASRMVHFMLCSQLWCNKPYEIWTLIGDQPMRFSLHEFHHITGLNCGSRELLLKPSVEITDEVKDFWELLDISVETGPSYADLLEACVRCSEWEREDRIKLGYLALYVTFIEAQPKLDPTKAALAMAVIDPIESPRYPWGRLAHYLLMKSVKKASVPEGSYTIHGFVQVLHVWILYALPVYAKKFGEPLPEKPTPPLLAYRGSRGRKYVRRNMQKQTFVNHFIRKAYVDMFPFWENDNEDAAIENIVKAMYGEFGRNWRWNDAHWPAKGILVSKTLLKASDADEEDEVEEKKIGKKSNKKLEDLTSEMQVGFKAMLEEMREGFVGIGIKFDLLRDKVDDLADDVSVLKTRVNGGDIGNRKQAEEVDKVPKDGGRKRKLSVSENDGDVTGVPEKKQKNKNKVVESDEKKDAKHKVKEDKKEKKKTGGSMEPKEEAEEKDGGEHDDEEEEFQVKQADDGKDGAAAFDGEESDRNSGGVSHNNPNSNFLPTKIENKDKKKATIVEPRKRSERLKQKRV